jgi:hypothetical protein
MCGSPLVADRLLVVVNIEPSLRKQIDFVNLEKTLISSTRTGGPELVVFPKSSDARARFLDSIRNGQFDEAAVIITNALREAKPDKWVLVSLVPDTADPERCFLSYLYFDLVTLAKYHGFLEDGVERTEADAATAILEKVVRTAGSPASRVETFKPISLCFLIDNSGSMVKNDNDFNPKDLFYKPEETARAGAVRLVFNRLTVNDEVAFVFFSGDVTAFEDRFRRIKDPKDLRPVIDRVVEKIGMQPSTDIGEAFKKTRQIVKKASWSNVYVILLSDGNPTQGETDFRKLRAYVRQNLPGIPFFVIGLEGVETESGFNLEKTFLKDLATETGGVFNIVKIGDSTDSRYGEVTRAVDNIFNIIRKEQTLLYDEPTSRVVEADRLVYSWDFAVNSECSEFTILLEPWETGWEVSLTAPDGSVLDAKSLALTPLVRSALCRVVRESCKGEWHLKVKVPNQ